VDIALLKGLVGGDFEAAFSSHLNVEPARNSGVEDAEAPFGWPWDHDAEVPEELH
jgi:hypothetical protein